MGSGLTLFSFLAAPVLLFSQSSTDSKRLNPSAPEARRVSAALTEDNEACFLLDPVQYGSLPSDHWLRSKFPDLKAYARHRSRIEVIVYDGRNARAARMTAPRNVTDQDEVYLRLLGDPFQWDYRVAYTTSALAERDVANVTGSPIPAGLFSAGASTADAAEKAAAAAETSRKALAAQAPKTQSGTSASLNGVGPAEIEAVDGELTALAATLRKIEGAGMSEGKSLAQSLGLLQTELEGLRFRVDTFASTTLLSPDRDAALRSLNAIITGAEQSVDAIPGLLNRIYSMKEAAGRIFPDFDARAAKLQQTLEAYQKQLGGVTRDAANSSALDTLQSAVTQEVGTLTQLKSMRSAAASQLEQLDTSLRSVQTACSDLLFQLVKARKAMVETDLCMTVGRFRDKLVEVTVTATPVGTQQPAAAKSKAAAPPGGEQPAPSPPPAPAAIETKASFEVTSPTHVHIKLGPAISYLNDPKFELAPVTENCTTGKQCFALKRSEDHKLQVRPGAFVGIPLPARYIFAEADPDDYYEDAGKGYHVPFPLFGVSITDPTDNYYFGLGVDISRGISINGGLHLGRVLRIRKDYSQDQSIELAGGTSPNIENYTYRALRPGVFISIAIDSKAIAKIFSGNGSR